MADSLRAASPQELALFSERIGRSLAERPLDISVSEHRERVAALVREVGGATFYELLAVGPAASPEKVHEGYERVARLVHPVHAAYLGLEGREGVLEVLFERATAAYITLSHPGRRRDYDRELGPAGWSASGAQAKSRGEENRDRARAHYNRAVALVAKEDYHFAVELLREAVRIDPQAKYFVLLAEIQVKNDLWLRHAAESYTRALELGGPDPRVEEALERVRRRMEAIASGRPVDAFEPAGRPEASASAQERGTGRATGSRQTVDAPGGPLTPFTKAVRYEIESTPGPTLPDAPLEDE
jgi:tetratricopeptide (TPR) repeat protein